MPIVRTKMGGLPPVPAVGISASPCIAFEEGRRSGCVRGWEDGYRAACESIQSMSIRTTFGPKATPEYAQQHTLELIKGSFKPCEHEDHVNVRT